MGAMPNSPADEITDEALSNYAHIFSVSCHAMLIRLVHLGYVNKSFYWIMKKPQLTVKKPTTSHLVGPSITVLDIRMLLAIFTPDLYCKRGPLDGLPMMCRRVYGNKEFCPSL